MLLILVNKGLYSNRNKANPWKLKCRFAVCFQTIRIVNFHISRVSILLDPTLLTVRFSGRTIVQLCVESAFKCSKTRPVRKFSKTVHWVLFHSKIRQIDCSANGIVFVGLSRAEFICILHYGLRLLRVRQKPFVLNRFTAFTVTGNSFPITSEKIRYYINLELSGKTVCS